MFTKTLVFSLLAFAAAATARADTTVLSTTDPDLTDGKFANGTTGFSAGTFIAESFVTGGTIVTLSNVVFPQVQQVAGENINGYQNTETFSLYADSTLSGADRPAPAALFNFSLTPAPAVDPRTDPGPFAETTATVPTVDTALATLLPNTRYWIVLANTSDVSWNYVTTTTYGSALGFTLPPSNTTITDDPMSNPVETIGSLDDGPQQFVLNVVPEPSTYCLLAVAGLALVVSRKRKRKVA